MMEFITQKSEGGAMEFLVVGILFGLLAFSGGAAVLADSARPGDRLYMLDRAVESIQKAFTFDTEKKASLAIQLMEERQDELYSLIESNADNAALNEARFEFKESVKVVFQNSDSDEEQKRLQEVMAQLEDNSSQQQEKIEEAIDNVPDSAREALKEAKEVSSHGLQQAQDSVNKQAQPDKNEPQNQQKPEPAEPAPQSIPEPILDQQ